MAREVLQNYRNTFVIVKCIIVDEVNIIGCEVLHKIELRLQKITIGTIDRSAYSTWCSAAIFVSYRPLTLRRFTKQSVKWSAGLYSCLLYTSRCV